LGVTITVAPIWAFTIAGPAVWSGPGTDSVNFDPVASVVISILVVVYGYAIGLVVAIPSALVAVFLLRQILHLRPITGAVLTAFLVLLAAGLGTFTGLDIQAQAVESTRPHVERASWLDLALSPVDLEWTVVNGGRSDLEFIIGQTSREGVTGQGLVLPACRISAGVWALPSRWDI
jgi:hypothetical protein